MANGTNLNIVIQNTQASYLNLGTTFQMTVNKESGAIAAVAPCHNAHNTFRSSSTRDLKKYVIH